MGHLDKDSAMPRDTALTLRDAIDAAIYSDETVAVASLVKTAALSDADRARICDRAAALVTQIRTSADPGLMEVFLAEYGLSTD